MIDVVAAVIIDAGRVFLLQRRPGDSFPLKWCFPGGKVDPGESFERALRRELDEEIGVASTHIETGEILQAFLAEPPIVPTPMLVHFFAVSLAYAEQDPELCEAVGMGWFGPQLIEAMRAGGELTPANDARVDELIEYMRRTA